MCYPTPAFWALQQAIPNGCAAKTLTPPQRSSIAVQALAGNRTITGLADAFDVSRTFVYRQAATAQAALDEAFATPAAADDPVLFHLPVTKSWLQQATLGLTLICHSSYRGVVEFLRDLVGVTVSVGAVHNTMRAAVEAARPHNLGQDLAGVDIAGLDEIFQNRRPVLVGADIASTYCFLLSPEEHRDADTWAIRLLERQERGLAPRATIADFGVGIRAGQKRAMPNVACRGDVFHALQELTPVVHFLENRAYDAIATHHKLEQQQAKIKQQARRDRIGERLAVSRKASAALHEQAKAIALADDMALLTRWLRHDVFAVSGLPYPDRCALFDFILAELQARAPLCPHRLGPVCTLLKNHRNLLLAFAEQIDQDIADLAGDFQVSVSIVRELLDRLTLDERHPQRWQKETVLHQRLGHQFYALDQAVRQLADRVVRASSAIENINSRLRGYFFLRRHLDADYLVLLQFFFNHRRFLRSERPERVGKSPAELLTGQTHPHWLELLGHAPACRN